MLTPNFVKKVKSQAVEYSSCLESLGLLVPIREALQREPDEKIGTDYLWRWFLTPYNPYGESTYLHVFGRSDDRVMHDHPWYSESLLLVGSLREYYLHACGLEKTRLIRPGYLTHREASFTHSLEVLEGPVCTIFKTWPKTREWGFHTATGWVHWKEYVRSNNLNSL